MAYYFNKTMNILKKEIEIDGIKLLIPCRENIVQILQSSCVRNNFPEFYEYVNKKYSFLDKWMEKLYWFYNELRDHPVCEYCGNSTKFVDINKGYQRFCCYKCSGLGTINEVKYTKQINSQNPNYKCTKKKSIYNNPSHIEILDGKEVEVPELTDNYNALKTNIVKNRYPEFYEYINTHYSEDLEWMEKLYMFYNHLEEPNKCECCGKKVKFISLYDGWSRFCSNQCSNNILGAQKIQNCKRTYKEKTGFDHPMKNPKVQEKFKDTCMKNYGVPHPMKNSQISEKSMQTNRDNHGGILYLQTDEFKHLESVQKTYKENMTKMKEYFMKNFGTPYSSNIQIYRDKIKNSKRQKVLENNPQIKDYDEDGLYVMFCQNPECHMCEEKEFHIDSEVYRYRIEHNIEPCTILRPLNTRDFGGHGYTSQNEIDDRKILDELNIVHEDGRYDIIPPLQLDIFAKEINLAIEENGVWCHNVEHENEKIRKSFSYHMEKWMKCYNKNIELISLWSDWELEDKKSFIKDKIEGKNLLKYKELWFPDLKENEWPLDLGWAPFEVDEVREHQCYHAEENHKYKCFDTGIAVKKIH